MNKNKGFTLIELLVVIAIIGILASVVLASLNSARDKGANAAIKSNLTNMRAQAAIFYDNNSNAYAGLCADTSVTDAMASADNASGGTSNCFADPDSWVIISPLKVAEGTSVDYCVDSNGKSVGIDSTRAGSITTNDSSSATDATAADTLCS